ncbi:MAG: helix-turn-helix transcriptional regulator [Anaerolineae bacterium]|nr:helix-turn-helix transcriptional regulator [Anaerolineae bacterium]
MDEQNPLQTNVGVRIKERRKQVEMTLDELAEKTGLTASFISQVERGKANISLNSLHTVAKALGVPVFYFVAEGDLPEESHTFGRQELSTTNSSRGDKFNPVVIPAQRSKLVLPNTGIQIELLVPSIGRKLLSFKARLEPGKFHVANRLLESTEEILYVISGKLTLEFTDGTYTLSPDESIYFEGEKLLRMISASEDEDTVWISTITPGIF